MQCLVPFLLFLLLVPLPAIHTQASSLEDIQIRGSLRVGMSGDYQPFSLCEGGGSRGQEQCQGLDVDIARRLAADLGVRLEIVRFRWPALMDDLI